MVVDQLVQMFIQLAQQQGVPAARLLLRHLSDAQHEASQVRERVRIEQVTQ